MSYQALEVSDSQDAFRFLLKLCDAPQRVIVLLEDALGVLEKDDSG